MQFERDIEALLGGAPLEGDLAIGGAYEGADRFDRDLALWSPPLQSADMDILPEKGIMDARVRDTLRNDAYMQGGDDLHRDGIVGSMFLLNAKPEWKVLGLDDTWAEEFQQEVEAKFTLAAESPNNWLDAARTNTLTAMVRLAIGVYLGGGEMLATVEWLNKDKLRPFSTAIQMIALDRLSNPLDRPYETATMRGGIEFDRYGAPIAYHIRSGHPGDPLDMDSNNWKRVPIRKPWGRLQVIHIHEQRQVDQSRGLSQMVAALKEMKITRKFRDITLQNAVVNATYAATIESDLPPEAAFASLGGGDVGSGIAQYGANYLGAVAAYIGDKKHTQIDGVKIPHLFPGTKLQLRNAASPGGVGADFEKSLLRYLASNLGVSYEEFSRDYSGSNYSSIRAAMSNTWKSMQSRKRMVADRFATTVYRLWLEEQINKGEITSMSRRAPNWYEGLNADAYAACEWIGASRGQIDELKETQAAVLRLKYHLTTYEDEMSRLGKDWRKALTQREREIKEMKTRGIMTPEEVKDEMMNATTGAPREKEASEDDGGSQTNAE